MPTKDGLNAEQVQEQRRREAAAIERQQWAQLYHIYERCVAIAEAVWGAKLETAAAQQQTLAEQMRDRGGEVNMGDRTYTVYPSGEVSIPVPLFTPRDRQQFVKEVAATLLISADRKNLTALYRETNGETELVAKEETAPGADPVEAASGADETQSDAPIGAWIPTDAGQRVPQASAPRI